MVRDYVEELYEPAATAAEKVRSTDLASARELAAWKAQVLAAGAA